METGRLQPEHKLHTKQWILMRYQARLMRYQARLQEKIQPECLPTSCLLEKHKEISFTIHNSQRCSILKPLKGILWSQPQPMTVKRSWMC